MGRCKSTILGMLGLVLFDLIEKKLHKVLRLLKVRLSVNCSIYGFDDLILVMILKHILVLALLSSSSLPLFHDLPISPLLHLNTQTHLYSCHPPALPSPPLCCRHFYVIHCLFHALRLNTLFAAAARSHTARYWFIWTVSSYSSHPSSRALPHAPSCGRPGFCHQLRCHQSLLGW